MFRFTNSILGLLCLSLLLSSCLSSVGRSVVKGAKEESVEELGEQLVRGIRKDLKFIASDIVTELDSSLHESEIAAYLEAAITDPVYSLDSLLLRNGEDAFFERLGLSLGNSVRDIRLELLGDDALSNLLNMRDELLGEQLRFIVSTLIDSSMTHVGRGYRQEVYPDLDETASLLAKTILDVSGELGKESKGVINTGVEGGNKILWTAGGVIGLLLLLGGFLALAYQRQKKTLRMVAKEVVQHKFSSQSFGTDSILDRINEKAKAKKLQDTWREAISDFE